MDATEQSPAITMSSPHWSESDNRDRSLIQDEDSALRSESEAQPRIRRRLFVDKHSRSLLKAISWRAAGTLDTIFVSFIVTGRIKLAVSIGFVELFTKVGLFYLHERVWNRIPLGRAQPVEDYTI